MLRKLMCGVALAAGLGLAVASRADDDKKGPTILEIMEDGHSGKKSLLRQIGDAVEDGKVASVEDKAKKLKEYGEALGKNKAPKGSAASWKKLTEQYQKDTKELAEAVGKKDQKASSDAVAKLKKSCQACHDEHKDE